MLEKNSASMSMMVSQSIDDIGKQETNISTQDIESMHTVKLADLLTIYLGKQFDEYKKVKLDLYRKVICEFHKQELSNCQR